MSLWPGSTEDSMPLAEQETGQGASRCLPVYHTLGAVPPLAQPSHTPDIPTQS